MIREVPLRTSNLPETSLAPEVEPEVVGAGVLVRAPPDEPGDEPARWARRRRHRQDSLRRLEAEVGVLIRRIRRVIA